MQDLNHCTTPNVQHPIRRSLDSVVANSALSLVYEYFSVNHY
ncbi:hypothetical protein ACF3DV_20680 [Chlorogloeopsis fritschii PCC 9212]|nr:hypothetical protein [Chlorogloeopsis fritschii]